MDNLSLAQWSKDPVAYSADFNRAHRWEQRVHSETLQKHVEHHGWEAQDAFRSASPTPGVVTQGAIDAARRKTHG